MFEGDCGANQSLDFKYDYGSYLNSGFVTE